eukprot:scaffold572134_cov38-Prasinocladus_malaysianus.AAC.1
MATGSAMFWTCPVFKMCHLVEPRQFGRTNFIILLVLELVRYPAREAPASNLLLSVRGVNGFFYENFLLGVAVYFATPIRDVYPPALLWSHG